MCIFLFRDGTIISFHPEPSNEFTRPIMERIRQRDTSLRRTADPNLLVQSLLDLIVDGALEVVEEYHAKINKLERAVLIKPKVKTVRDREYVCTCFSTHLTSVIQSTFFLRISSCTNVPSVL